MINFKDIEKKWQNYWDKNNSFVATTGSDKKPYYILVEFPYPSGSGLHVGHVRSYTAQDGSKRYTTDVVADNVQFLDTRKQNEARASAPTPYDYQDAHAPSAPVNNVNIEDDPFADFGDNVSIDDNFLD